jgi:hypothetical protein
MSKEQIEELRKVFAAKNPAGVVVDKAIKSTSQFKKASERLKERRGSANKPSDLDTYSEMVQWHDAAERIKGARYFSSWRGEPSKEAIEAEMQRHLKEEKARREEAATNIQRVFRGHQGRKEFDKQLIKQLASGEIRESLEQEKRLAQERLQQGQWFKRFRSGPDKKVVLAEVMANRERQTKIRQDRFAPVKERREQLAKRNEEKRAEATARREEVAAQAKARREEVAAQAKARREEVKAQKAVKNEAENLMARLSSFDMGGSLYKMMSKSIEIATVDGQFKNETFILSMNTMLLGPDFQGFKENLAEKDRKAIEAAEKKLDADLVKLAKAIDHGIKTNTLDTPENGVIRKCVVGIAKTVGLIVILSLTGVALVNEVVKKIAPKNIVSNKIDKSLVSVIDFFHDFVDHKTKSSSVEAAMDKMVRDVEKNFGKQMSVIAKKYCQRFPNEEISDQDKQEANKRIQARKWFGSVRSKPGEEEVVAEVKSIKAQQQKEFEAVKFASRFQDRFQKINTGIRTFAGREQAKRAEAAKGTGHEKQ